MMRMRTAALVSVAVILAAGAFLRAQEEQRHYLITVTIGVN